VRLVDFERFCSIYNLTKEYFMKKALRTIAVAGLLMLIVALSFGQQMTAITTIAGDAVTAQITRGAIAYLPSGVIWIAAGDNPHTGKNFVYLSTDNGTTWVKRTLFTNAALSSPAVDGIAAKDANTALVCTTTGEIFRTTNGGVKWDTVAKYSTPDVAFCDGIAYVGQDTLVAYGDAVDAQGVYVARSVDGGATWTRFTNFPTDSLKTPDIYAGYASYSGGMASYGRTAWATLYNTANDPPGILKTTDGGATWSWFRVTLPGGPALNYYIRSITFKDQNVGFAVCKRAYVNDAAHDAYLVKTTDGGRTWSDTISVEPGKGHNEAKPMTVRAIPGTNTVVAVGWGTTGAKSWISNDNGTTWAPITTPTPNANADLRNIAFGSATQGMAVGYYAMTKFTMGGAATDSVNVTFWANTSTVPDTLKASSFVQIRGAANVFGPWSKDSKAILTNVAGDYWKGTVKLKIGDTIQYKFFTNANKPLVGDPGGWENNSTDASGNRILIVGSSDMTLPIQYVNGTPTNQAQFFTPFVNKADSIEIYFRINMQSNESFSKNTQYMGVRGAFAAPYDGWGKSIVLTKESQHGNGSSQQYDGTNFWSGYTRVPKSLMASAIEYKFVILDAPTPTANVLTWEDGIRAATDVTSGGNRQILASPGASDTTLYWKWWANAPYAGFKGGDTVIVNFRANLASAIAQRGFSFGDTIQVRTGYGSTAKEVRTKALTRSGITGTIFTATDTVVTAVGQLLNYQYYLVKSGNDVRESFYNYDFSGTDVNQAERRQLNVTGKSLTMNDTTSSVTDMRRMPRFPNTTKLVRGVTVTYTLNLRPAFYQTAKGDTLFDIQGTNNITKNSNIKTLGVGINGPAVGGWASWGPSMIAPPDTVHKMYDDGTHGDAVSGDTIYTVQYKYTTADALGQVFKFGIGGSDNEGGRGGFGNNHAENIDDSQTTFLIASDWGSINPKYYNTWDFTNHKRNTATGVEDNWRIPMAYELSQNYPNPFNPSTEIRFALPTEDIVTLKIFNVLGQELMTLMHEKLGAGSHTVRFDASTLTSGVYLYQITAGKFSETKKMVLMK
jgi:photosystem II stability/assembly factor-like uncharacterized protein